MVQILENLGGFRDRQSGMVNIEVFLRLFVVLDSRVKELVLLIF